MGLDVRDFWRSRQWARFDSFVEQFELDSRSWLSWAQTNDVDRYEAAQNAGTLKQGKGTVHTFEWSETNNQLNRLIVGLDHLTHITAVKGTKSYRKKFKAPKLTWPTTALDGLKKRAQERRSKAQRAFQAMFEFVPETEWQAELAEHQAALEANPDALTPVQERALAEAEARASDPDDATLEHLLAEEVHALTC